MKFIAKFCGCKAGDVYPTDFEPGDDCPAELEAAAISVGAVDLKSKAAKKVPETK